MASEEIVTQGTPLRVITVNRREALEIVALLASQLAGNHQDNSLEPEVVEAARKFLKGN